SPLTDSQTVTQTWGTLLTPLNGNSYASVDVPGFGFATTFFNVTSTWGPAGNSGKVIFDWGWTSGTGTNGGMDTISLSSLPAWTYQFQADQTGNMVMNFVVT